LLVGLGPNLEMQLCRLFVIHPRCNFNSWKPPI
jgi:hypothetical protein